MIRMKHMVEMIAKDQTVTVDYVEEDIVLDFNLYTEDSTNYHATYNGPATYR
mgnify:CR=1 FL=1